MRKLLLGFMLLACGARASTPNVTFTFADFTTAAQRVRMFNLYPLGSNTNGASLITQDRVTVVVGTNGSVTVSNVVPGDYRGEFVGTTITTTNCFTIPSTTGTINAISNLAASGCAGLNTPGASGGYTKNQANSRFLFSTNSGSAGKVFTWVSGSTTGYWATATGGSGGSATNLTPWASDINAANFALTNVSKVVSTNFTGNGVNVSNVVGTVTVSNSIFVMKGGNNSTALRGRLDKPFSTLLAAQAASVAGDLIYVYPGCYTNADLGSNFVNWYFYPGTYLFYDSAGLSGGIFTDNPTTWLGVFSDGTNSRTFNIYGHVTATNLTDGFLKVGGAHSRISLEYDTLAATSQNGIVIAGLFNTYSFGGAQGTLDTMLNVKGQYTEGTVYLSETAGTVDVGYFTNGLLYLDRDTADPVKDLVFRAREARNCAIFGARPSGSKTVIDVPLWVGSAPFTAQGSYALSGIGYFHSGEIEFKGTTFVQATNATSTNLFYCEWGSAYATSDYTNQVKLTFNNCRVLGRTGGGTNQLIRYSTATSTNAATVCILGQLEVANFLVSGMPRQECAGQIIQNQMIANLRAPVSAMVKGVRTNWMGTNFYSVIDDSVLTSTIYDAFPDDILPQPQGLMKLSSAGAGSSGASIYGFLFYGDGGGLTNIQAGSVSSGTIGAGVYASNVVSGGKIPTATLPIIPPDKLGGTNGHSDGEAWTLDHGTNKLASVAGSGTVTSVGASGPAGFTWSSAVTSSGTLTATTPSAVLTNGAAGYFSSVNVTGTGPTVIYGDANGTNALLINPSGAHATNAAGSVDIGSGVVTASGRVVAASYESPTNLFSGNLFLLGGTNHFTLTCSSNLNFTGVTHTPAGNYLYGEFTCKATGTVVVTNPVSWFANDGLTNRTLTNGNLGEMSMKVVPGLSTNFIFVQSWHP